MSGTSIFTGSHDYPLVALFIILAILAIATAFLYRILAMRTVMAKLARDSEVRLRMLAEAIPQVVWTAGSDGSVDYCNRHWYELTGFTEEQTLGTGWANALHPDDRPLARQNWESVIRTGQPFQMEYRLLNVNGDFVWYLVRAAPMRDSTGAVVKWFGSCTDINDQMRHQAVLEEQIKQHTSALMDANTRLQSEIHERALTQQELNRQSERMVLDLTGRSNRATALAKMAELLQSCASVKDACSVIAGMGPKIFPDLRGAVLLLSASRESLEVSITWLECGLSPGSFGPQDCWALRTGKLHAVAAGDRVAECRHACCAHSYVCLPLTAHGDPIGVVHFQMIEAGDPPEASMLLANMFAVQIGLSVANIRLREALRDQSIRDPLTGLYNRRYLEEIMEREMRRAIRSEQGLGVLMLDLDHFKEFNDTYGHDAGDTVLREAAAFLLKSVRAEDIVCRFGGEEFVIILPVADLKVSQARAERIRSKMRELKVTHQGQPVGTITVSIGVAELPQHGTSPKELLEAADAALYCAKREGRDRVMIAVGPVDAGSGAPSQHSAHA